MIIHPHEAEYIERKWREGQDEIRFLGTGEEGNYYYYAKRSQAVYTKDLRIATYAVEPTRKTRHGSSPKDDHIMTYYWDLTENISVAEALQRS